MFIRAIANQTKSLAGQYPIVTILGPRQSGKTTLAKAVFPEKKYFNLELPDTRALATADPRQFLEQCGEDAIIDEIQRVPSLLSYLQDFVDNRPDKKGLFILTGSHQLELHQAVTQSLAGRTALLHLLPLSISELKQANILLSLDAYLLKGFFPRIYNDQLNSTIAHSNYVQTYLERDVRQIINIKDLLTFQHFLKLCASRVGQPFNMHNLSSELGVSTPTIKNWLSVLEASFIIFRLPPYFENFGKRITKSPKIYFTDVGLAAFLLNIETQEQMERDPLRGFLFENLVVMELIKTRFNQGLLPQVYYYRDHHQHEVDVLYKKGTQLIPIEIKASKTFHVGFLQNLKFFQSIAGDRCQQGFLIYGGSLQQKVNDFLVLNFENTFQVLNEN